MNIAVDPNGAMRAEVQRLRDRGFQVVRLRAGIKMAYEKGWPDLVREAEDFEPGENVGVRFGPQSSGLVDVDLDYPTARALVGCPAFGLDHLVEFGRASQPAGRRGHRLAIAPDGPDQSRVFGIRLKKAARLLRERGLGVTVVEIRGSHGSQTSVPPSIIRAEGKKPDRLVWTNPHVEIPEMSWVELNRRVGRLAFCALAAALYPGAAGDRDAFCLAVFGALIASGVDLDTADQMVAELARVAGDDIVRDTAFNHAGEGLDEFLALTGLQDLGHTVRSWLGLSPTLGDSDMRSESGHGDAQHIPGDSAPGAIGVDDLQRLLDALDPCDFPGYHDHLSIVQAAHHATAGSDAGRELVVSWSARNPDFGPGKRDQSGKLWGDVVRGLWDRAKVERDADAPMNTVATILYHVREAGFGHVADEVRHRITFESDRQVLVEEPLDPQWLEDGPEPKKPAAKRPSRFKRYSIMELLDLPDPVWTVEAILMEHSFGMIYGAPKSFKTFLSLDLGLCIATGRPFHGHAVIRGTVTYVAAEGNPGETRNRVLAWCRANGVEPKSLEVWFKLVTTGAHLDNAAVVKEFIEEDPEPCDVTFIDTVNRSMAGDESSTKDMTAFVAGCDEVRRRLKTMVVAVHHSGVNSERERGSTVLRAAVDTRLRVTQKQGVVTLEVEDQRAGPSGERMYFRPVSTPVRDLDGPESVVMRPTEAPGPKGYQGTETTQQKVSAEDVMLLRISEEKPEQYADLVSEEIRGFSKANVYKVKARLLDAKLLRRGDRPALTKAGEERVKELLDEGE